MSHKSEPQYSCRYLLAFRKFFHQPTRWYISDTLKVWWNIFWWLYCRFTSKSPVKRIFKMGLHLAKLWARIQIDKNCILWFNTHLASKNQRKFIHTVAGENFTQSYTQYYGADGYENLHRKIKLTLTHTSWINNITFLSRTVYQNYANAETCWTSFVWQKTVLWNNII